MNVFDVRRAALQFCLWHRLPMNPPHEVEAEYVLSFWERLRANGDLVLVSPRSILIFALLTATGAVLAWQMGRPSSHNGWWDYFLVAACFTYYPLVLFLRTYRSHLSRGEQGPFHYRFDDAGIHVTTGKSRLTLLWPAISRVRASKGMLFLHVNRHCAHCVPLRALDSPQSVAMIEQLALAGGVPRLAPEHAPRDDDRTGGIALTVASYRLAFPGGRCTIARVAIVSGALPFLRGFHTSGAR